MPDKETEIKCKKNYLGASSLMFGIFAISGCWIPLFNILAVSLAIVSSLLGVWSLVKILRVDKKSFDKMVLSICGILVSLVAVIIATSMNHAVFSPHGGIKNFMTEVMDAMTGKNIGGNSQKSSNSNQKASSDTNFLNQTENTSSRVYKIGESAELEGRTITLTDVQKNFNMNNEYSTPKEGSQFVKIAVKVENTSDSEIVVSPYELRIQDGSGAIESLVSVTYLLDDQFESATLIPAGSREGAVIFEVPENDENLKLVYQPSSADASVTFDLQ